MLQNTCEASLYVAEPLDPDPDEGQLLRCFGERVTRGIEGSTAFKLCFLGKGRQIHNFTSCKKCDEMVMSCIQVLLPMFQVAMY